MMRTRISRRSWLHRGLALAVGVALTVPFAARATETIRVYKVGSSSFPAELMIMTKDIIEASGDYNVEFDSAGYTRLDDFATKPYLFSEWTNQYLPVIAAGNYDYVVFQTIGWFNLKPEQLDALLTDMLPAIVSNIQLSGAQVVLYEKYPALLRGESDPLARAWAGRYPEGVYLNDLHHVKACKYGVDSVTFGGGAVHELWDLPHYEALDWLYNGGHPGPLANYISACCLAKIMTGISPVGSTMHACKLTGWQEQAFNDLPLTGDMALYVANSNRVHDGYIYLTDTEADELQQTAIKWYDAWNATMHSNLIYDAQWAFTTSELARIYQQMTNYAAYNLSQGAIDKLTAMYEEAEEGQLTELEIEKIRRDTRSMGATVENLANDFLTPAGVSQLQSDYNAFWDARNSKFRDDVYFQALCYLVLLEKGTNADEVARMNESSSTAGNILWLGGMKLLLERITPAQRQQIMDGYKWGGARKRHCPRFYEAQMAATSDWQRMIAVYEAYWNVWDDPNLMDRLKGTEEGVDPRSTNCFLQSVWLEADALFVEPGGVVASPTSLSIPEGGTNAFNLVMTGTVGAGTTITVTVARISANYCDIVVTSGAPCYFTSANWDTPQPVTLAARDDAGFRDGTAVFRCTASDGTVIDINVQELDDDNVAPDTPGNVTPTDGATNLSLSPVVQASAFSDANAGDTHSASQWQLATNAPVSAIVWDSGTDSVHLTSVTLPTLAGGRRYWWRVRYRDASGLWSGFSTPTWFETDPTLSTPPVANADSYMVTTGSVLQVAAPGVLANDTDTDDDPLTAVKLSDPEYGLLVLNADGSFTYTPGTNWPGSDSFTYCANDGKTNSNSAVCQLQSAGTGVAGPICDYFAYGSAGGSLAGLTTLDTAGWGASAWSGSPNPLYVAPSSSVLFASSSSEAVAYRNTVAGGCLRGANGSIGTIMRDFAAPLDGTIWMSLVATCSFWNATADFSKSHVQVLINGQAADSFGAMCSANSSTYRWFVFENGTLASNDVGGTLTKIPALLVARLRTNYDGSDDELTLWLLPCFGTYPDGRAVANLGPAAYVTSTGQDIWGDAITNIGIAILSQSDDRNMHADSLRISHSAISDDLHVYEVLTGEAIPEPAASLAAAFALLVAARRTKLGS